MIDSVTIRIYSNNFHVTKPENFSPVYKPNHDSQIKDDLKPKDVMKTFSQGKSGYDKSWNEYMPQMSITQRMKSDERTLEHFINISFSVPKLIFGNSLDEISEGDMDKVIKTLKDKLFRQGVSVTDYSLRNAIVTKLHVAKNIQLPKDYPIAEVINKFSRLTFNRKVDNQDRYYANGGRSIRYYTHSHDRILYDKLFDVLRNKNVSIDKVKNMPLECDFVLMAIKSGIQVIRFETRYNTVPTIRRVIKEYSKNEKILFSDIFSLEIWRSLLISEFSELVENPGSQLALKLESVPEEVFSHLVNSVEKGKQHNLNIALGDCGLYALINKVGVVGARNLLRDKFCDKTIGLRLNQRIERVINALKDVPSNGAVVHMHNQISECKPMRFGEIIAKADLD